MIGALFPGTQDGGDSDAARLESAAVFESMLVLIENLNYRGACYLAIVTLVELFQ